MEASSVWSNIFKHKHKENNSIFNVLRRVPIFKGLSVKELNAVERILHRRTYRKDEVIFHEDESGMGMYIIESGHVDILLGQDNKLLAQLTDGDFFGEMALLLEQPRTATAIARSHLKMLGFFQPDLFSLLETRPRTGNKILQKLAQMLAERLYKTNLENRQLKLKLTDLESQIKEEMA
ncbi:MAG: cyclic nucleotide-binding domain-containing protein [Caldithrix sp.]|nr:cyclic nucleotide-binding domain-containing protein [Caldithrix sp.]